MATARLFLLLGFSANTNSPDAFQWSLLQSRSLTTTTTGKNNFEGSRKVLFPWRSSSSTTILSAKNTRRDKNAKSNLKPPPPRVPTMPINDVGEDLAGADIGDELNEEILDALRSAEQDLGGPADGGGLSSKWSQLTGQASRAAETVKAKIAGKDTPQELDDLAAAEQEAAEAEVMLKEAEEEAARWERELAEIEATAAASEAATAAAAAEVEANSAEEAASSEKEQNDEEDALASMSSAYQAALDAANENVDLLTSQVASLESELAEAVAGMERTMEEKERVGAEYAFLVKDFGELKKQQQQEGQGSADGISLQEEIKEYRYQVATLEQGLAETKASLQEAQGEAAQWKNAHTALQSQYKSSLDVSASVNKGLELRIAEASALLESQKEEAQSQATAVVDELTKDFETKLNSSRKMASALREVLRKTRREKSYLQAESQEERAAAVDDVRRTMIDKVANLKNVLKRVEGEMEEKEGALRRAGEERKETERLMMELSALRETYQKEQSKYAQTAQDYQQKLSAYAAKETELRQMLVTKDKAVVSTTSARDANAKKAEELKLELEALQTKMDNDRAELERINADNAAAFDAKFAAEVSKAKEQIAGASDKIASLEEDLKIMSGEGAEAKRVLEETCAELKDLKRQYDNEVNSAAALKEKLKNATAKIMDLDALIQKNSASEKQKNDGATKAASIAAEEIQALQLQANALTAQLAEANAATTKTQQSLQEYETRVESMSSNLLQSSTDAQDRESELSALRTQLAAATVQADTSVKEQITRNKQLQKEMERLKKKWGDALAKANVEITQRDQVLKSKEGTLGDLRETYMLLQKEMEETKNKARGVMDAHTKELKEMESALKAAQNEKTSTVVALEDQIKNLKESMSISQKDALKKNQDQTMVQQETEEAIAYLKEGVAQEKKLRDEALQSRSKVEAALRKQVDELSRDMDIVRKNADEALQQKDKEVQQMRDLLDKSNASVDKEKKENARLQSEVQYVVKDANDKLAKAKDRVERRDSTLSKKDELLRGLEQKTQHLEEARAKAVNHSKSKDQEIAALKGEVLNLTTNLDKAIKLRQDVLTKKERVESVLQKKTNEMIRGMDVLRAETKKELDAQTAKLKTMEESGKDAGAQVVQLKNKMVLAQKASEEALALRNEEIAKMKHIIDSLQVNIAGEKELRDKAVKDKLGLESALGEKIKQIEREKQALLADADTALGNNYEDMQRTNERFEKTRIEANKEVEKNQLLQKELEKLSKEKEESVARAEVEIGQREAALNEMRKKSVELEADRATFQQEAKSKSDKILALKAEVSNLTASVEKEIKLRQDILAGKEGIESVLQKKIHEMTASIEKVRSNANKKLAAQAEELKQIEGSRKDASAQIVQMKQDMASMQEETKKVIDSRNRKINSLEQATLNLKSNIKQEQTLRNEAVQSKARVELALQNKLNELSQEVANARADADKARGEADQLTTAMNTLQKEIEEERASKEQTGQQLNAKIVDLETKLEEGVAQNEKALQQRDNLLSTMRADLASLSKLKDEEQSKRNALEKTLTTQNFELRNKMNNFQMSAEKSLKSKDEEVVRTQKLVAKLQASVAEEIQAREASVHEQGLRLAKMEESFRAKTEQAKKLFEVAQRQESELADKTQLQAELEQLRSNIQSQVQLREKILGEKAAMESKLQAEVARLQNDAEIVRKDAAAALLKLDKDLAYEKANAKAAAEAALKQQQRAGEALKVTTETAAKQQAKQQANDEAEAKAEQRAKQQADVEVIKAPAAEAQRADEGAQAAAETKRTKLKKTIKLRDERPKPKGFGKPTTKKANASDKVVFEAAPTSPPKKMQLVDNDITGEEAEKARIISAWSLGIEEEKSSVSDEQHMAGEAKAADLTRQVAAEGVAESATATEARPPQAGTVGAETNPMKRLTIPQATAGRIRKNSLANLLMEKDTQLSQASFPKRDTAVSVPSSQSTAPRPNSPPSFPKRKLASPPSSQATSPRQGAPASQRDPAQKIVKRTGRINPLTSLILENRLQKVDTPSLQREPVVTQRRSLRELIPSMTRTPPKKTSTKLGEMANPENAHPATKEGRQEAMKQSVTLSAATTEAKAAGKQSSHAATKNAGSSFQEAFQRALLSARIANEAHAKVCADMEVRAGSARSQPSGLGEILRGQNKVATLSQQKAFANRSRRTSLFPDKRESHLSRLLHK